MPYADPEKAKEAQRRWRLQNLEYVRETSRRYAKQHPKEHARHRRRTWWRSQGLNPDEVECFLAKRVSCEICGKQTKLVIDHNHQTTKLRGVLCSNCNRGIGLLCDNAALCEKAAQYLRSSE